MTEKSGKTSVFVIKQKLCPVLREHTRCFFSYYAFDKGRHFVFTRQLPCHTRHIYICLVRGCLLYQCIESWQSKTLSKVPRRFCLRLYRTVITDLSFFTLSFSGAGHERPTCKYSELKNYQGHISKAIPLLLTFSLDKCKQRTCLLTDKTPRQ